MKLNDLIPWVALAAGAYIITQYALPGLTQKKQEEAGAEEEQDTTYYWKPSQLYYPEYVYNTQIPVVPSEPGVSEGIPIPTNPAIPLCPDMTVYPRYEGDDQKCCQCPNGALHCGSAWNMDQQMSGRAGASWQAICNL